MDITTECEVLSAAADDWESLDHILLSARFEFASDLSDPSDPTRHYWRDRNPTLTLTEVVGELRKLVESGLMIARNHDGKIATSLDNLDVLQAWFRTTEAGLEKMNWMYPI